MPSAKELRDELRMLRKEKVKPVSRMRVADISAELERLKAGREETPAAAATPSAPARKVKSAAESIKSAKAAEFPVMPAKAKKVSAAPAEAKKKPSKLALLKKMMDEMGSESE